VLGPWPDFAEPRNVVEIFQAIALNTRVCHSSGAAQPLGRSCQRLRALHPGTRPTDQLSAHWASAPLTLWWPAQAVRQGRQQPTIVMVERFS